MIAEGKEDTDFDHHLDLSKVAVVVDGLAAELELAKGSEDLTRAGVMGDEIVPGTPVVPETETERKCYLGL